MKREIGIISLPFVMVPPNLEAALGYRFDRRYVAFYWAAEEGVLCYTDGHNAACGSGMTNASGWHLYVTHPKVQRSISGFNVYSEKAAHALILDREERLMYAAAIEDAREVLAGNQVEKMAPFMPPTAERKQFFAAADVVKLSPKDIPDAADIYARAEHRRRIEREMLDWLDSCVSTTHQGKLTS